MPGKLGLVSAGKVRPTMTCNQVDEPPRMWSQVLEDWADIKESDGLPFEAAWYRKQARELRKVTDADVLRSKARDDRVPLRKDHLLPGGTVFICGERLKGAYCACGSFADFLCDKPIGNGKTCDLPICDKCRIHGTNGRQRWDFCPRH